MIKIIGIDPDLRKPGVVECVDGKFKFSERYTYTMSGVLDDVKVWMNQGYIFAVEDVNTSNAVFKRGTNSQATTRIAQNVGMVKASAIILIDWINYHGGKVMLVPPGVGKQVKKNAKLFKEITGYQGRTNEDTRDAWAIANYAYNKLKQVK